MNSEVVFIGGRSGVGKSSVGHEMHRQLIGLDVRHAFIEGDNLDLAHPPPWAHGLAEQNLAALWANYRAIGYRRLIYANTVAAQVTGELTTAMGDRPRVTAVLLTSTDATAADRLAQREIGSALDWHVDRSTLMAAELDAQTPNWVHRVRTDDRPVANIATEIIGLARWG